jgi:hypothetical protein
VYGEKSIEAAPDESSNPAMAGVERKNTPKALFTKSAVSL